MMSVEMKKYLFIGPASVLSLAWAWEETCPPGEPFTLEEVSLAQGTCCEARDHVMNTDLTPYDCIIIQLGPRDVMEQTKLSDKWDCESYVGQIMMLRRDVITKANNNAPVLMCGLMPLLMPVRRAQFALAAVNGITRTSAVDYNNFAKKINRSLAYRMCIDDPRHLFVKVSELSLGVLANPAYFKSNCMRLNNSGCIKTAIAFRRAIKFAEMNFLLGVEGQESPIKAAAQDRIGLVENDPAHAQRGLENEHEGHGHAQMELGHAEDFKQTQMELGHARENSEPAQSPECDDTGHMEMDHAGQNFDPNLKNVAESRGNIRHAEAVSLKGQIDSEPVQINSGIASKGVDSIQDGFTDPIIAESACIRTADVDSGHILQGQTSGKATSGTTNHVSVSSELVNLTENACTLVEDLTSGTKQATERCDLEIKTDQASTSYAGNTINEGDQNISMETSADCMEVVDQKKKDSLTEKDASDGPNELFHVKLPEKEVERPEQKSFLFIGSSNTRGLVDGWRNTSPNDDITSIVIPGARVSSVRERLFTLDLAIYDYLVIHVGLCDIFDKCGKQLATDSVMVARLVDLCRDALNSCGQQTTIILCPLPPKVVPATLAQQIRGSRTGINETTALTYNIIARKANIKLSNIFRHMDGLHRFVLAPRFWDGVYANSEYFVEDCVHFSPSGCMLLADYVHYVIEEIEHLKGYLTKIESDVPPPLLSDDEAVQGQGCSIVTAQPKHTTFPDEPPPLLSDDDDDDETDEGFANRKRQKTDDEPPPLVSDDSDGED